MRRASVAIIGVVVVLAAAWVFWPKPQDRGRLQFFSDRTYNFEASRVLNDVAAAGGDTGEAAQAVAGVKSGDAQGWYSAWQAAGDRTSALALRTNDPLSKGNALLRAHTYYRTAEFFLSPHDPQRPVIWRKNIDAFYRGLDVLGVIHERMAIPYGDHHLNAVYYPGPAGAEARPLLVVVGG
jgi:hypothetical protein